MKQPVKIVVDPFPARNLPKELRRGLGDDDRVRVTIEDATLVQTPERTLRSFVGSACGAYASPDDALAAIRSMREDWQ